MGHEVICSVRQEGKSAAGKALLESTELLFRGDIRLKIPFASITALHAVDGELHVRTKDGLAIFALGEKAEKWRERISNPKSLVQKLGPKAGDRVTLLGTFTPAFLQELKKAGAVVSLGKSSGTPQWIFLAVETPRDVAKIKPAAKIVAGAAALWIVYPKGQKALTEHDVRSAGLNAGLTDVKVASFSATHTALKFVIPKAKR